MLIEIRREIILSPRGARTLVYVRIHEKEALLHGLSSRLNDVEKRVERAKGSGETRHEHRCIVVEEQRTRKDRLSRWRKRGGEKEKREKGEKKTKERRRRS